MNKLELALESSYRSIHESKGSPSWALDIEPAIPFVGNEYDKKSLKCLIFGSAENLTHLKGNRITANNYFRNREVESKPQYFTNIHMAPISDGSLLTASRFILANQGYDDAFSSNPKIFLEEIATVNFGKYSIQSETNIDYAGTLKHLKESFDFIKSDLEILDPDIVILPKKIFDFLAVRTELFSKKCIFIPIYQTNLRVINSHLNKIVVTNSIHDFPFVGSWLNETISGMDKYLSWLEQRMSSGE
ncbi:hypothetical protein [Moritella sp.]|uniref:hypothetical protein n=1 Tax=Moritella sp. TaxID=78556 RepID=UPI0025E73C2D|nr:hypothetical protein [Moritella sp.]MCJ8352012.1 hypothetical protein [Moritella sp.]